MCPEGRPETREFTGCSAHDGRTSSLSSEKSVHRLRRFSEQRAPTWQCSHAGIFCSASAHLSPFPPGLARRVKTSRIANDDSEDASLTPPLVPRSPCWPPSVCPLCLYFFAPPANSRGPLQADARSSRRVLFWTCLITCFSRSHPPIRTLPTTGARLPMPTGPMTRTTRSWRDTGRSFVSPCFVAPSSSVAGC